MGFFLLGPLLAVPPLAATLAYDTGVPVSAESEDRAVRSHDQQLSTAAEAGCAGGGAFGHFVAGPLHGDVVRNVCLAPAPQQIRPLANLHFGAALVGRRVAAITVDAGEDLRVALLV